MKVNGYQHVFLYAKHWYKRSDDVFADLKKILEHRNGVEAKHISNGVVVSSLAGIARDIISESPNTNEFTEFVNDVHPANCWKIGYTLKSRFPNSPDALDEEYDYYKAVVYKILSMISMITVLDDDGNVILDIGEPDENILPLREIK